MLEALTMHARYASYVFRHKWYVGLACAKEGLWAEALFHDWSKFLPTEWNAYAAHFFGPGRAGISQGRSKSGYYKPTNTGDPAFDDAWFHHVRSNRHHWQSWCCPEAGEEAVAFPMTERAVRHMICDWRGAARAQGFTPDPVGWFKKNKPSMILHPTTFMLITELLDIQSCGFCQGFNLRVVGEGKWQCEDCHTLIWKEKANQ